jgi:pyruvate formate lyase activating enzyme
MPHTENRGLIFNIQKFSIHDGPGIRTTVFFQGCPLRCAWCSNPESQMMGQREGRLSGSPQGGGRRDSGLIKEARLYSADEVLAVCLEDEVFYAESGGGVTLSGGEALAQAEFAAELLEKLGEKGIHRAIETSGFAPAELFGRITARTELVLFDLKHHNRERHIEGTGVDNTPIIENLRRLDGKGVLPRIPVVPGYNDGPADAEAFADLLASLGLETVQLLPFHQFGKKKYEVLGAAYRYAGSPVLHPEDLGQYREIFIEKGIDAFF